MFRTRNAVVLLLLNSPIALGAQASPSAPPPAFELRGRISDTSNAPLSGASVSLRLKTSPVTIAGAGVGRDGAFRLTGLRPGTFSIRVTAIGYSPVIQDITISPDAPVRDLGTAKLAPQAVVLSDLTVKEERATMTAEPDKNSYSAKAIAPGAANASELLENVPSV